LARDQPPLGKTARLVIALLVLAGILAEFRTIIGPQGGVALLVGMSAMKLLETGTPRDRGLMILIGYFLVLAPLIHDQSLPLGLYLIGVTTLLTGALIANQPSAIALSRARLRLAALMLAQALPIAMLLFILFPRIPAPFGGLAQAESARTGLSDSMMPGSVSELIQTDTIAFRAEFEGPTPTPAEMYWRGPVLWDYDGRVWRMPKHLPPSLLRSEGEGRLLSYAITLEPHRQRWLFTLGLPHGGPDLPSVMTPDMYWLALDPIKERVRYRHAGYLDYRMSLILDQQAQGIALALPEGFNPRTRDLARGWLDQGLSGRDLVDRALAFFRDEAFYYTLRPPRLGVDAVDDFLFVTRRGFCEHYASAFVVLMRAAGMPARVVTGYQGGEFNPLGRYWVIRQRDAHAWAEVWLPGQGWIRIDPTAAVAPQRVEHGIGAALPSLEQPALAWDNALLRPIGHVWDMAQQQWNRWVIGYDHTRQRALLERLHPALATLAGMLWAILALLGLLLGALFWSLLPRGRRARLDPYVRVYRTYLTRLRRAGIATPDTEGPTALAERVARLRPDLATSAREIAQLYSDERYGHIQPDGLARLRARIKRFKP
jgi:transglutaminase-like putative cysteine protease